MPNPPRFVDNQDENSLAQAINQYLNELDERLAESPSLDIATGYFNSEGFFTVMEQLKEVEQVRLLLGTEPKEKDRKVWWTDGSYKRKQYDAERIEEAIQSLDESIKEDRDLLGFSMEVNEKLQEMISFLRQENVEVRRFEDGFLHGKAFIFSDHQGVIAGSSNFTYGGMKSNRELNLAHYNPEVTEKVNNWFEELWENSNPYDLPEVYERLFEPFDPYLIYLRVLWERYRDELEEEKDESGGELELTTFQNDGLFRAKRFLEKHNGAIIADSVGLGKTYIAGQLIHEAVHDRRQRALLIAPAYLIEGMWDQFQTKLNVNIDMISFAKLRNDAQLGGSRHYLSTDKDKYQLVVIDEAHAFRNPDSNQSHALRALLRGDPPKDLLLLTATPVNNSLWDLYYELSYFIKNDAAFSNRGIKSLRDHFKRAQAEDPTNLSPDTLFDVLDETTVRRTRHFIREHYEGEAIEKDNGETIRIRFPDPVPKRVEYNFEDTFDDEFFDDISSGLAAADGDEPDLSLARYRPMRYMQSPEEAHLASELALAGLLRTGLLKRFESSKQAFSSSLGNMIEQYEAALSILNEGMFPRPDTIDEWVESDTDEEFEQAVQEGEKKLIPAGFDADDFKNDLRNDIEILSRWKRQVDLVTPREDAKLQALKRQLINILSQAREDAANEEEFSQNRKVLIFSYFEDTVQWILEYLDNVVQEEGELDAYFDRIAGVVGDGGLMGYSRQEAVWGFAPDAMGAPEASVEDVDILVTTDVLAQGVNLQDCRNVINYDLPWNPMRIVQRNGRIDRIGSPHPKVYNLTFFPEDRLNDLLQLEHTVRQKLTQTARAIGLENEVIPDTETLEKNFADRREEIEELYEEETDILSEGGRESAAYSGEEYRRELKKGLQDREGEIEELPWGAGSGFRGEHPGYFFCARVQDKEFYRFIAEDFSDLEEPEEIIESKTLTCLRYIECDPGTERYLPEEKKEKVYDAWKIAREDIFETWQSQTDPKNIQPYVRPLFHQVADHLREYPPDDLTQDELQKVIESVEAPLGRRYERELRDILEDDSDPYKTSRNLVEKISDLGLEPFKPPDPLDPIEREEIKLVCWLAITQ